MVLIEFLEIPVEVGFNGLGVDIVAAFVGPVDYAQLGKICIAEAEKEKMNGIACGEKTFGYIPGSFMDSGR